MESGPYAEWESVLDELAGEARTVAVLGATDTGKTTFCIQLANRALRAGRRVAMVDADVGQSEIGPPTCVGVGLPEAPFTSISAVAPAWLGFVGATSPASAMVEHVAVTSHAFHQACVSGADLVLLDTTGMVRGAAGRRLKHAKMRAVRPQHVVALQRRGECDHVLAALRGDPGLALHDLPVAAAIGAKPGAVRAQRRALRFARQFEGAEIRSLSLDAVALAGTWLNSGPPLAPHLERFVARALRQRVYHAEMHAGHLGLVLDRPPAAEAMGLVHEQLQPREISVLPVGRLQHLLVALEDGAGRALGLGLIESVRFRGRELGILTTARSPGAVRVVRFGLLRVQADGTELGPVRATDL